MTLKVTLVFITQQLASHYSFAGVQKIEFDKIQNGEGHTRIVEDYFEQTNRQKGREMKVMFNVIID